MADKKILETGNGILSSLYIDELRNLVNEGIESGASIDGELVFSRLRKKYSEMVETNDQE